MTTTRSKRLKVPQWALYRIAERDGWKCHICEQGYRSDDPWRIDHDVALAKGGTNHIRNLRLAHRSCNDDKGIA